MLLKHIVGRKDDSKRYDENAVQAETALRKVVDEEYLEREGSFLRYMDGGRKEQAYKQLVDDKNVCVSVQRT